MTVDTTQAEMQLRSGMSLLVPEQLEAVEA